MKSALKALPLLLLSALANAGDMYRVEVMMFAYLDEESAQQEHWPASLYSDADQIIPDAAADDLASDGTATGDNADGTPAETPAAAELFQPAALRDFVKTAERMRYRRDIKVVWHQAWIEEIQDSDNAIVHPVEASYEGDLKIDIDGEIRLQRSRYIHIVPDLNIQQYVLGFPLDDIPVTTPATTPAETDTDSGTDVTDTDLAEAPVQAEEPVWMPLRAAHLTRSRRMRSDEVHYLDHPLLGMLVKVTPYAAPVPAAAETAETESGQ